MQPLPLAAAARSRREPVAAGAGCRRRIPFAAAPAAAAGANPFAAVEPVRGARARAPRSRRIRSPPATARVAAARAAERPRGARHDVDPNARAGSYTYSMIKSGPDVNPDEVEVAHASAIEVMVLWDTNVLHVPHLTPPRSFYVGEEQRRQVALRLLHPERDARHDARAHRHRARPRRRARHPPARDAATWRSRARARSPLADLISQRRARARRAR